MVLRVSCIHVVSPPFRLPQRLYDRFPLQFLLKLPDLSLLLFLPTPFVDSARPPPTQALISEMALMATVLVRKATLLLQARAAIAAIQVMRAVIRALAMAAARKRLQQLLLLLLVIKLRILPSLP